MIIDNNFYKIDKVIIEPSKCKVNGKDVMANVIKVFSRECNTTFCFWTKVPFEDFNILPMDEKVSIMDKIDSYDLTLNIDGDVSINNEENSEIYFTRIGNNVFKMYVLITDFDKSIVSNDKKIEKFELNVILSDK